MASNRPYGEWEGMGPRGDINMTDYLQTKLKGIVEKKRICNQTSLAHCRNDAFLQRISIDQACDE